MYRTSAMNKGKMRKRGNDSNAVRRRRTVTVHRQDNFSQNTQRSGNQVAKHYQRERRHAKKERERKIINTRKKIIRANMVKFFDGKGPLP